MSLSTDEVIALLKKEIAAAGSQFKFCIEREIHPSTLCQVLHRTKPPTPAILDALGLQKVVGYEPIKKSSDPGSRS